MTSVMEQLERSLQAEAVVLVGDLYGHVERGHFADFVSAWRRFHQQHQQPFSQVQPLARMWRWGSAHDQTSVGSRLEQFQIAVGPLLRNLTALDAGYHWQRADAAVYGLCQHEAEFSSWLGDKARAEAAKCEEDDEQIRLRAEADKHMSDWVRYRALSRGEWL